MPFLSRIGTFSFSRESCFAASGFMFVKNILLFINFLSLLAGLILIGGGGYIQSRSSGDIVNLSGSIAAGAIVIGCMITIISFLGCFGAANEKGMLLKTYFALLILLVVLEIGIGAAAYHKQEDLGVLIEDSWRNNAYANSSITESIKTLEISFKCCGLRNITDAPVPKNCASKFEWNTSCYDAVLGSMESSLDTIGATGLAMGLIELVAIVFSAVLFNRIAKKEKQGESLMTDSWRINRSKVQYGYQNYQYL